MRTSVRFLRRGEIVELDAVAPTETLLDYLRLREGSMGTKEGCCEGDCGACTVAVGVLRDGHIEFEPVNACITFLGMLDGKELVTVDDLATPEAGLHPVQSALVEQDGSQCGFCTPGFVMSLFTLYQANANPDRQDVNDWLSGNLCRCTGYRPIAAAALEACSNAAADQFVEASTQREQALVSLSDAQDLFVGDETTFFAAPASLATLADLYASHPDATLVAGATDVGLWVTKHLRELPKVVHLGRVAELHELKDTGDELIIGAALTYARAEAALGRIDPDFAELLRRLGAKQVRASGTVGGNIANGSPIGDSPPALIALGATLELQQGNGLRVMPLEDFFLDYGRQDRRPAEFVSRVTVPKLAGDEHFRCYKISRRFDQDISALLGAFKFTVDGPRITAARVAFGGMAATPKRARKTEQTLRGARLDQPDTWNAALDALSSDFTPIDDLRASAGYRIETARALLTKALLECSGVHSAQTRVTGMRDKVPA